jgi:PAS domain S-box-containing protein
MSGSHGSGSDLWPALITLALVIFLGSYGWSRRNVRAATPFAVACLFAALWIVGVVGEISAAEFAGKVFWLKFQVVWHLPAVTAIFCFVLAYAGLGRWLSRRNLILLALPPALLTLIVLSNDFHHLNWTAFRLEEHVVPTLGRLGWVFIAYGYLLGLVNVLVLMWLAVRLPQHRWPVAIMLLGQLIGHGSYFLDKLHRDALGPGGSIFLVIGVACSAYALALFRFHVFDPIPLARAAVVEQMHEGMLVLDAKGRIVELNSAAREILGDPVAALRGRDAAEVLTVKPELLVHTDHAQRYCPEVSLGAGKALRYYTLNVTPLTDRHRRIVGYMVLLHDVTDQKREQEQRIEQQQVVATLQERERLARELHDGIGQVLGYVSMQAQTASKWVQDGNAAKARALLDRLTGVARDAHADVRESILGLRSGQPREWSFIAALDQYLKSFQAHYRIRIEMSLGEGITENCFTPGAGVQVLRVIQEALTNARKHGTAGAVKVTIERNADQTEVTISDDGCGFEMGKLERESDNHFGLLFMRERIAQVRGSLKIDSRPGAGTVVRITLPLRDQVEERNESIAGR